MIPLHLFTAALFGWLERQPRDVIEFLREENRVLKRQLHGRRLQLCDDERRRLAVLGERRVHVLGSTPYPDEEFVIQTMRHLTDPVEGILRTCSILICDRDRKWSVAVQHFLKTAGV